jgi:superfamily II DNA or RNA helicase
MIALRPYQHDLVERAGAARRPLITLVTGGGKTLVAVEIIRQADDKHVLFLAHRRELIHQAKAKLADFGVGSGVILAGEPMNAMAGVQVASVQTLWSRMRRDHEPPHADILFIDEAHHVPAQTYRSIIDAYPDAQIIGLTATPCRRDGRGLGSVFDELIEGPQVADLIKQGYLVGTKVYAPSRPNLAGVHVRHGDYVEH